ncbi:MAG TPA: hypothetical protein VJN96_06065 [Vicinamibacterales bacterium]|nr:hypothetical protein [Vicinamibacterales bacterium]
MPLRACLLALSLLSLASPVFAQSVDQHAGQFLYGLSTGAGRRTTSGTLSSSSLPLNVGQPPGGQTIGVLDLSGGVTLGRRIGVLAVFEQASGAETSTGKWGTLAFHGVVRGWVAPRVWVEGGFGSFDLGYRPPGQSGNNGVTRLWAASPEAAAGVDIFRGAHVTIGVMGRYSTATFGDFRVSHFSIQVELLGRQ